MKQDEKLLKTVRECCLSIDAKFGSDIKILHVGNISSLCDYFIIATSSNVNQQRAICQEAEKTLEKRGLIRKHAEGLDSTGWALLDFGDVIVHIFDSTQREFYDLERLWGDAEIVNNSY